MGNNKTTTTGGNATPTLDSLQELLKEKRKPKSVSLANKKKCLVITEPGSYIGVPVKVQPSGYQLAVTFNMAEFRIRRWRCGGRILPNLRQSRKLG